MKIILIYTFVILAVLGLGYWLFTYSNQAVDPTNLPGQAFEIQGRNHIAEGTHPATPYNSNPPTSGDHYATPAPWGVYNSTQVDEQLVHNLEHGGIWVSYKTSVDPDTVAKLQDLAKRYKKLVVEPRDSDTAPISFASWGYLQNFDHYDESAMIKFIEAHYDQGPEKVM